MCGKSCKRNLRGGGGLELTICVYDSILLMYLFVCSKSCKRNLRGAGGYRLCLPEIGRGINGLTAWYYTIYVPNLSNNPYLILKTPLSFILRTLYYTTNIHNLSKNLYFNLGTPL